MQQLLQNHLATHRSFSCLYNGNEGPAWLISLLTTIVYQSVLASAVTKTGTVSDWKIWVSGSGAVQGIFQAPFYGVLRYVGPTCFRQKQSPRSTNEQPPTSPTNADLNPPAYLTRTLLKPQAAQAILQLSCAKLGAIPIIH